MDSYELFEKANKLYATGNYQEAIDAYIKILKKTPNKVSLYTNLAVSYVQLQKYSKAEETFFSGLKINKSDFSLYKNLALMYFSVGDIEASITVLQMGLKKVPQSAALNSLLGDCYRRLDKIDEDIT